MMGKWEMDGGCKMQKFWGEGEEAGELYMGGGIAVAEKKWLAWHKISYRRAEIFFSGAAAGR